MNTNEAMLQAIASLWPELPALVGSDWPQFEAQLTPLLAQAKADPANAALPLAQIMALFEQYHDAHMRLIFAMNKLITDAEQASIKGWTHGGATFEESASPPAAPITRYTDIQLPARVQVDRRFAIVVGLTVTPSPDSADVQPVAAPAGQVVRVVLAPSAGLELLGERARDLRMEAERDSDPAVFYLRANAVGRHDLGIEFWLGSQIVASSRHSIEAVAEAVVEITSRPASQAIQPGLAGAAYPDLVLRISTEGNRLHYDLHFADVRFVSVPGEPLRSDPETYRYELIGRIEALAKEAQRRSNDPAALQRALEREGQNLYKELFSVDMRREYRRFWRQVRTIQIISDEPWIPWELIKPYDDDGELLDHDFLCMQFELARWFTPSPAPAAVIRVESLAAIAPSDSKLAAAQEEREDMRRLAQARALIDRSPALPTRQAVLEELLEGNAPIDLWHFACHGDFTATAPTDAPLLLQKKERLLPRDIVGRAQTRLKRDQPLVVFNACRVGQSGLALTGMGGWAKVLVQDCGVGAFLAPMWEVTDSLARAFAAAFYQATLETPGRTLASAVCAARHAVRQQAPHDPTWLAYALYAHPNARLAWDGSRG